MARPSKYDWIAIERDYKAGIGKPEIRKRYKVPRNTLDNRIRDEGWEISGDAVEAMSHLGAVTGHLGAIAQKCPEIIRDETDFNLLLDDTVMSGLRVQKEIFDRKKVTTETVANGEVIEISRDLTPKDIKDGMDGLYRAKEIKFGKEFPKQKGDDEVIDAVEVEGYELAQPYEP